MLTHLHMKSVHRLLSFVMLSILLLSGCRPAPATALAQPTAASTTAAPAATPTAAPTSLPPTLAIAPGPSSTPRPEIPYQMVSADSVLAFLEDLINIQAYSGWRSAGSQGEVEAHQYVEDYLKSLEFLNESGMRIERQTFPVYITVELWETRLLLEIDGHQVEVPVNGLRGSRYQSNLAQNFDSDGGLSDTNRDPITASGPALLIRSSDLLYDLTAKDVEGRVLFLDYALIDTITEPDAFYYATRLVQLISYQPAGLVLVTQYSNVDGESRGSMIGDGGVFQWIDFSPKIPILHAHIEDMGPAGITQWEQLEQAIPGRITSAHLTWDEDALLPGQSGNLIAHIPGADPSKAVILGAHVDSPNNPGAFDDGLGVAILLETARVIDAARIQPPVDVYLAWFGAHEVGTYGSAYFAATHQELLDRTLAMLEIDCLGYPMEGHHPFLNVETWTYGQYGDDRPVWPEYLAQAVASHEVDVKTYIEYDLMSDNSNFAAFDVPNADLIYSNFDVYLPRGSGYLHYASHWHDSYETIDLAREVSDQISDAARTALAAALQTGQDQPDLRVAPQPTRRALFIANHTQTPDATPMMLLELGMALAWQGFDVDLIPYGQPLTSADLQDASLVVLLPTLDYPKLPSETWANEELNVLEAYVKNGGLLVITNSYYNLAMTRTLSDTNEDSLAINALTERFGVTFTIGLTDADLVHAKGDHPLIANASYLEMLQQNGVPFNLASGLTLATAKGRPVLALIDYGASGGQVLIVGDLGLLSDFGRGGKNLMLLQNLARYAWER